MSETFSEQELEQRTSGVYTHVIRGDITLPLNVGGGDTLQTVVVPVDPYLASQGRLSRAFLKMGGVMGQDGPFAAEIRAKAEAGILRHGDVIFTRAHGGFNLPCAAVAWVIDDFNRRRETTVGTVVSPAVKAAIENNQVRIGIPAIRTAQSITSALGTTKEETVKEIVKVVKGLSGEAPFPVDVYFVVQDEEVERLFKDASSK